MERPLCPLCGKRHFAREPHEFGAEEEQTPARDKPKPETAVLAGKSEEARKPFDRKAYQREYMKRRRAAAKGKAVQPTERK